jgi:phosphatidylinositol glycan class T
MYAIERQPSLSPLSVNRIITTPDQSRGTLHISVINNEMHVLDVLYTETLPPLVTLYLHTRAVTVDGTPFGSLGIFLSLSSTN